MKDASRCLVVGGAGFIGSHFVDRLMATPEIREVVVYDNFSSGREWHLADHGGCARPGVVRRAATGLESRFDAMTGDRPRLPRHSTPEMPTTVTEPGIDFQEGSYLTHHVVEAMRITETPLLLYASGSGIYGDLGELEVNEDHGPLLPISTYGASKLAGEALICS